MDLDGRIYIYIYNGEKQDIVLELTDYGGLRGIEYCYVQVILDNRSPPVHLSSYANFEWCPNKRQPVGRRFKVNFDWFDDKIKI